MFKDNKVSFLKLSLKSFNMSLISFVYRYVLSSVDNTTFLLHYL